MKSVNSGTKKNIKIFGVKGKFNFSLLKKIAFGDNLSRQAIQIEGGIPPCYLNKGAGKVRFSVVRKVLYTFLHHKKLFLIAVLLLTTMLTANNGNVSSQSSPASATIQSGCVSTNCISLGKTCGTWSDGCGHTLNCGTCASL